MLRLTGEIVVFPEVYWIEPAAGPPEWAKPDNAAIPAFWCYSREKMRSTVYLILLWAALAPAGLLAAPQVPANFAATLVASGLTRPTAMAFAPDGRLFVCEQDGALRVIKNGALLPQPFTTISVDGVGERGLLGVAFDPEFQTNQYVYVYYTVSGSPKYNRVSRFTANGDVAQAGSEALILRLDNLSGATNHNGGAIHFGRDSKLYVAAGDNANGALSQSTASLLGKILRVNRDGSPPADNPFYQSLSGDFRSIWALGLRNPFNFAFERSSFRMYINDVGEGSWEEINVGQSAANYGWPTTEGPTANPSFKSPLYAYPHSGPVSGCSIVGAAFYDPETPQFPTAYKGGYFFADLCSSWVRYLDQAGAQHAFATNAASPVDLGVDSQGRLFILSRSGDVYRVDYQGNQPSLTEAVSPRAGSGSRQTFTYTFSDPDGALDLTVANVLLNDFLDGRDACYVGYHRPSGALFLVQDDGSSQTSGLLGAAGTVSNSQCTIYLQSSSASAAGDDLQLTLDIEFKAAFAGDRVAFLAARDSADNNSGWQALGVWRAPPSSTFPQIVSVSPNSGSGGSVTLTTVYRDAAASSNLQTTQILLNNSLDGRFACYLGYDRVNNLLYLVDDAGSGLLNAVTPGVAGTAQNSQCVVNGAASSVSAIGADLTLTVALTFKPFFRGDKIVYLGAQTGSANSDWHALGAWSVP